MSSHERSRHLSQFVAESEPPPLAQHLPPLPPASQRFTSTHQQKAVTQPRNESINYIDPFAQFKSGDRNFDPFHSLVMQKQMQDQQNNDESTSQEDDDDDDDDEDDSSSNSDESTVSTTAESLPPKRVQVVAPKKVVTSATRIPHVQEPVAPFVATKISQPRMKKELKNLLSTPAATATIAAAPAPVVAVAASMPAQNSAAPFLAPPTVSVPIVNNNASVSSVTQPTTVADAVEEPRGIMDQSMSFLKRNFWAILTVIVILVAIGVAFIYFARPKAEKSLPTPKKTPEIKAIGPPGSGETQWSQIEGNDSAELSVEQIAKLQEEKKTFEEENQQLLKRFEEIEKRTSQDQKKQLSEIEKLQKMCESLLSEKEKLQENNIQLAEFITQQNLLSQEQQVEEEKETIEQEKSKRQENSEIEQEQNDENDQDQKQQQPEQEKIEISRRENQALEKISTLTQFEETEKQKNSSKTPYSESATKQTDFSRFQHEEIDLQEIEKSANEQEAPILLETIDTTQMTSEEQIEATKNSNSDEEIEKQDAIITEEKLPWQKN